MALNNPLGFDMAFKERNHTITVLHKASIYSQFYECIPIINYFRELNIFHIGIVRGGTETKKIVPPEPIIQELCLLNNFNSFDLYEKKELLYFKCIPLKFTRK